MRPQFRIIKGAILGLLLCLAPSTWAASTIELALPGGKIRAEVFETAGARVRPVVIVLHGAGGMLFDGPEMRRVSRRLAEEGNAVYLLHYFERTGTVFALDGTMQRHFPSLAGDSADGDPGDPETARECGAGGALRIFVRRFSRPGGGVG